MKTERKNINIISNGAYNDQIQLREEFISKNAFLFDYLNKAEMKLAQLKSELEKL